MVDAWCTLLKDFAHSKQNELLEKVEFDFHTVRFESDSGLETEYKTTPRNGF
jgi:hypothetical protein